MRLILIAEAQMRITETRLRQIVEEELLREDDDLDALVDQDDDETLNPDGTYTGSIMTDLIRIIRQQKLGDIGDIKIDSYDDAASFRMDVGGIIFVVRVDMEGFVGDEDDV